ncbi:MULTISPECIES: ATP-binding protein [unclassified Microcoleus]|uniref:ATP-binding protein n=1 Tax=unclassified Microcoleus TaxID=2642155 RepID=UPI002FD71A5B
MTKWLRPHSLSQRLLVSVGLSIATVGLATLGLNYRLMQSDLETQVHNRAQSITQSLEFSTEGLLELENKSILRRVVQNFATMPGVLEIAIVDPSGMAIARSPQNTTNGPYTSIYPQLAQAIDQAATTSVEVTYDIVLDGKPAIAQILPFSSTLFGTSQRRGVAIALLDLNQMKQAAHRTFITSTLLLLVGIITILLIMGILLQKNVLQPLRDLTEAVSHSKKTGIFPMPKTIPANEIQFLASTFEEVFRQLEIHAQLTAEIAQRKQIEVTLRDSEARERDKSQQLEQAIETLKRTQTQLIQTEKISSLGQLVAGVAHEINNPVGFIHSNLIHVQYYADTILNLVHLYQKHYPNPIGEIEKEAENIDLDFLQDDLPKILSSMRIGTDRIRQIVLSLRNFSRMDESDFKEVDIHEGIDSTLLILQHRLKARLEHPEIKVIRDYGDLPLVECYAGQLNQVFMNVLANAIDALEEINIQRVACSIEKHPCCITICTSVVYSQWVKIAIADNGNGIPESIQTQIFNPFFTTKPVGKGTGMGMAISYQIITEKHGGTLRCFSTPEKGTEFEICIPVKQQELTMGKVSV